MPCALRILSELCVPLKVRDQIIGVVNVESKRLDAYQESDQHLLETMASQIAISIQNAQLFKRNPTTVGLPASLA